MSVRLKLVVLILLVALLPLGASALTAAGIHDRALRSTVSELHGRAAEFAAASVGRDVAAAVDGLALFAGKTIDWRNLSSEERAGALWLVYRRFDDAAVVTLLDGRGQGITSAFAESTEAAGGHPPASQAVLEAFAASLPFEAALRDGAAIGTPFAGGDGAPVLPLATAVEGADGGRWVVVLGLSLRSACAAARATSDADVRLLDATGKVLCPGTVGEALSDPLGDGWVGAAATVAGVHGGSSGGEAPRLWRVVVRQPAAVAYAASDRLRLQALLALLASAVLAVAAGLSVSRAISGPLDLLVGGANELSKGNFDARLAEGSDEFGRVSTAFNRMAEGIRRRDAEIRAWNEELQRRVEERTRELREAQDQILQATKLSAVSALAAGMAHEINNPLATLLAISQLVRRKLETQPEIEAKLRLVEAEARRIEEIVRSLINLADTSRGGERFLIDVDETLDDAIAVIEPKFTAKGIRITRRKDADAAVLANGNDLKQIWLQLLNNSLTAMKEGGEVEIDSSVLDGKLVKVQVKDDGKGIPPENLDKVFEPFFTTKDDWSNKGLGLSVAYRVVQEHNGSIKLASAVGEGTTVTVTIPVAKKGSVLV